LRGASADPGYAQLVEDTPDLGRQGLAGEFFFQGQWCPRLGLEDPVAVTVEGERDAPPAHHLPQEQEVALGVFLLAEDGVGHVACRVVDRTHESKPGAVWAEPLVTAAVNLQEHPTLGHPLAA